MRAPWSAARRASFEAGVGHHAGRQASDRAWPEGSVQGQLVKLLESQQISPDLSALLWSLLGLIKCHDLEIDTLTKDREGTIHSQLATWGNGQI